MAVLEQSLTDPLGNAAVDLAVNDERVHRAPDIVDRGVADDIDSPGFRIDLDLADLRAVWKACDREAIGAGDAKSPGAKFDVGDARLETDGRRCDAPCR